MRTALLFALFALFMASCKKPQAFDYRDIRNIKLGAMGFEKSSLSLDLVYFNPNGYGVDLKKIDADVYVDSSYLGKFLLDTMMHIPRKSEFTLPAKIDINMKAVLKNGLGMLFNKQVLIRVTGTSRLGRAGFYKTIPFNYEEKHTLSMFK